MRLVRQVVSSVLTLPGASSAFRPLLRNSGVILMLHRFAWPDYGIHGEDPAQVRRFLSYLRDRDYELVSLGDMFQRLREGRPLQGAIAFTIDDGYRDQVVIGGSVFAEFDCPVTIFATTGFVDRKLWFWWDKIEYIFSSTSRREISVQLGEHELQYSWQDAASRCRVQADFTLQCKNVSDTTMREGITRLAESGEVDLPLEAPDKYAPLSWDEARKNEERGITFGPHTVTHPILSHTPDQQSEYEISHSWERLSTELQSPVPIFCYPNGERRDFGEREIASLRRAAIDGAVVGEPGYARTSVFRTYSDAPYRVPRFSWRSDFIDLVQYVSGVERMKEIVRGSGS